MSDAPTGSDYLLSALAAEGVSILFGLVGEGNSHLIDRTNDADLDYRYARHEQVAVTMADGYARIAGDVGVCTLTHGPGLTNGMTGLAAADRDNVPLVLIIGDTAQAGAETSLQYLDHLEMTGPVSVYGTRVESPETLPKRLRSAFAKARLRSGPVVVEVPSDVQAASAPETPYEPRPQTPGRRYPDPDRIEAAAAALDESERPVTLAGGGAATAEAGSALESLAEQLGAPIVTTFYGRGVLPESHPMVAGIAGTFMPPASAEVVPDADAVLAVGAQLAGKTTRFGDLWEDATIVHVDVDEEAIGHHRDADVGVLGDARVTVKILADAVSSASDRADAVRERLASTPAPAELSFEEAPNRIDPRALTVAVSDLLPDDAIATVDSGNNTGFPAVFHRIEDGGRMLVNGNFGSMGYALPASLGAKVAAPDRAVVCYTGDGGILQVMQDVETAVRYGLNVTFVVYNDASYGIIRHRQRLDFDRETGASYETPDLAAVARGLGADAATVRSREDLAILKDHLASDKDRPLLLDARTIPDVTRPGFPPY